MTELNTAEIIEIDSGFDGAIQSAAGFYSENKIFIYPTDTIYGFGGNPFDKNSVNRLNKIKGRDESKKFIWLADSIETVLKFTDLKDEKVIHFLSTIWPSSVTFVLNSSADVKNELALKTVAFRIPDNSFCLQLLNKIKKPLISTSVNSSKEKALTDIDEILDRFTTSADAIFVGEKNTMNKSSTIINLTSGKPELLREGNYKFTSIIEKFYQL